MSENKFAHPTTFWGKYGYTLGHFRIGCAVAVVTLGVNLGILLASQMWAQSLETDVNKLWINPSSATGKNLAYVDQFENIAQQSETELFSISPIVEGGNAATPQNMAVLMAIEQKMMDTVILYNGTRYTIYDVCYGASSQSSYVYGCDWLSPMDYFSEGALVAPLQAKAQYVLDGNQVYGSPSQLWAWSAAADALGGLNYFGRVFVDECVNTGLIYCKDKQPGDLPSPYNSLSYGSGPGSLQAALDAEINSNTTTLQRQVRAAWIKAKTIVTRMMQLQNSGVGIASCSDATTVANSKPPTSDLSLAPCALVSGAHAQYGTLCPTATCDLAAMAALKYDANFTSPCGSCVGATMYWIKAMQVQSNGVATVMPTTNLPTEPTAGYLSQFHIYTSTDVVSTLFTDFSDSKCGSNIGSDNGTATLLAMEHNVPIKVCLDVFNADHTMALNPAKNYIAQSRLINAAFTTATNALDPSPYFDAFSVKTDRDAAWRNILINGAVPGDLGKYVNRHRWRASLASATTEAAVLRILSGVDNDFSIVQNATRAIFGRMTPDIDHVTGGTCSCNPNTSGLRCEVELRDGLCDCGGPLNAGFPPSCVTAVLEGCARYASCGLRPNIAKVEGLAGLWDNDAVSKDYLYTFVEEVQILVAFNKSQQMAQDYFDDRCMDQAPCAGRVAQTYYDATMPSGFSKIANDTGYFIAHTRDLGLYPNVIDTTNRALYMIRQVLTMGTSAGSNLTSSGMAALTSSQIPGITAAHWDTMTACMTPITNITMANLRSCSAASITPLAKPATCSRVASSQLTSILIYFQCLTEMAHGNTAAGHLSPRLASIVQSVVPTTPYGGVCTSDIPRLGISPSQCHDSLTGIAAMNAWTVQQRGIDISVLVTGLRYPITTFSIINYQYGRHAFAKPYVSALQVVTWVLNELFDGSQTELNSAVDAYLAQDCTTSKQLAPPLNMNPNDCESAMLALNNAINGAGAVATDAKNAIGLAMIKYKIAGVVMGNCGTDAKSSLIGGAICWKDDDCTDSDHGTCVGLENAKPLTFISAMAFILFTNNAAGDGMSAKMMDSATAKYRELANRDILARNSEAAGRRELADQPEQLGAHYLSKEDAAAIGNLYRIQLETIIGAYADTGTGATTTFLSSARVSDIIAQVSAASSVYLIVGYVLMLIYAALSLSSFSTDVPHMLISSRSFVGVSGVILIAISVASGLGLSALIGLKWSAAATQILPFIMLGLGVNDLFVMIRTMPLYRPTVPIHEALAQCLTLAGPGMMTAGLTNASIFAVATLTGMPVVSVMAVQAVQ